jgi:hypothetical protein
MTVKELLVNVQKLIDAGKGDCELIYRDCRSGDTGGADIYADTAVVEEGETMGRLCDEPIGTEYVPVYCDH